MIKNDILSAMFCGGGVGFSSIKTINALSNFLLMFFHGRRLKCPISNILYCIVFWLTPRYLAFEALPLAVASYACIKHA